MTITQEAVSSVRREPEQAARDLVGLSTHCIALGLRTEKLEAALRQINEIVSASEVHEDNAYWRDLIRIQRVVHEALANKGRL